MQLPLNDGRAVRMIQALLAAADPLDRVERGSPPHTYDPLAESILAELRSGADARRIILAINDHAMCDPARDVLPLAPVAAFAEAVTDWWRCAADRWSELVAV